MTADQLQAFFGWSALFNMVALFWWFLSISLARDWTYAMHNRFIKIPEQSFNQVHYAGMLYFKVANFMIFIVPYIVLEIVL